MEVAPRIAGTMGLARNLGVNMPLLTLYNMWGFDVNILNNENQLTLDRAFISRFESDIEYDTVYVDYDDTIVMGEKVNPYLMAFLYQARNKGKKLVLLSKHRGDLDSDMSGHCISRELFDEVIWLKAEESKADFIKGKAIFIDDSFAERRRVREACAIPVFDLDMVESLMDWRS